LQGVDCAVAKPHVAAVTCSCLGTVHHSGDYLAKGRSRVSRLRLDDDSTFQIVSDDLLRPIDKQLDGVQAIRAW
jgi:hypothetical protein